jgi:uncharacterized membrane protein YbhN (UPF0104 family)
VNRKLLQGLAIGVAVAALVYVALAAYADWGELRGALGTFPWLLLLPVLLLSLANYGLRFLRWQLYLRHARVPLGTSRSLRIFLSGLVMSVTPGKMGELLKAYLVRAHTGTPVTRTGPVVVAERLTDLTALFVLICAGSLIYRTGFATVAASAAITALLLLGLASPRVAHLGLGLVERLPPLRRFGLRLEHALASMRCLLRPQRLFQATLLGTLAWFAECLGFALVCHGFAVDVDVAYTTFVYAFATLGGALVLLPGGLGGTEVTMVVMLVQAGAAREFATAATLLTRVATLWFAVLLGALVLLGEAEVAVRVDDAD